jgi:ribosome production factor 1
MFASVEKARLQEIGPRFTLKLRWLRKGLPAVTAADGRIPGGAGTPDENLEGQVDRQEQKDEDEAMMEMNAGEPVQATTISVAPLDEEQEYEWKWRVSLARSSTPQHTLR